MSTPPSSNPSSPTPSPAEAADLLDRSERLARDLRSRASASISMWLVGMAVASCLYLTAIGVAGTDDEGSIVLLTLVFVAVVVALVLTLIPGAKRIVTRGFNRRFGLLVGLWGLIFGLALAFGLTRLTDVTAFWIAAGLASAVPLTLAAWLEARS